METKYLIVTWPDIQHIMDLDGFDKHSYLINDEQGIEDFGSSAYFVLEEWYKRATQKRKFEVGEIVFDNINLLFGEVVSIGDKLTLVNDNMAGVLNIHLLADTDETHPVGERWECDAENAYKMVEGKVDNRAGNPICYEHSYEGELVDYPYFSPFLDENLYEFEVNSIPHK